MEQQAIPSASNTIEQSLSDLKMHIEEKIKVLSSQIQHLLSIQSSISMEVDTVTQSLQVSPAGAGTLLNTTASSIVDKLAERERRKNT